MRAGDGKLRCDFPRPYNVHSRFGRLGLNTKQTKLLLSELTSTAIQCSFVIWLNTLYYRNKLTFDLILGMIFFDH